MFDSSVISGVSYRIVGASLRLSWLSSAPAGTTYQIYAGGLLRWRGRDLRAAIPLPQAGTRIEIGAVGTGEEYTDFSTSLPAAPRSRPRLTWLGGAFEGSDIQGFRVYGEPTAGGGIDYDSPLADIQAYAEGLESDGYGEGGYGEGGYGSAGASYSWEGESRKSGTWEFAVVPYDSVGNEGTPQTVSVDLLSPPAEVPLMSSGDRLSKSYNSTTHRVTIGWLQSLG